MVAAWLSSRNLQNLHHSICNDKWLIGRSNVKILQVVTAAPRNGPSLVQKDLKSTIRCDSHDAKGPVPL